MATNNYKTQGEFPLLIYEVNAEVLKKDLLDDGIIESEEELNEDYINAEYERIAEEAESYFREFNNESRFYEIEVIDGYYCGIQANVNWIDKYYNKEDLLEINDEDAEYYYGESARDVLDALKDEEEKVRGLLALVERELGFIEIIKIAQFSNGEAVYKRVKKGEE